MVTLNTSLQSIGISQAKGVDAFMLKDQVRGTMPRGEGAAEKSYTRQELTPEQKRQVEKLKQIDRQVREHEAAHLRAGRGVVTSGANFTYTYGPDGKQYAVGGEVGIDTSPESKPQENIDKGIRIQVAALAPRDPSAQDRRVAAVGGQLESKGRTDLVEEQRQQAAEQAQTDEETRARYAGETPPAEQAAGQADDPAQAGARAPVAPAATANAAVAPATETATRERVAQAYASASDEVAPTVSVFA
jgi:hypothetical protein